MGIVMERHRKAQVYSLIALLLSIPIMLIIAFYITEVQNIRYGSLEKVLSDQLHEVESGLENDFEQAMSISGKRAFLSATDYVISNGEPLDDAELRMDELMTQGTLYSNPVLIMNNNTIQDWLDKISSLELGYNVSVEYRNPSVSNLDGTNARLITTLDLNVSDYLKIGKISRNIDKEVSISLQGLEDPIFPLNTLGFVGRTISEYPYPYHAIEMVTGSGEGSCSGNVTFDAGSPDPDKILVTPDATLISGFAGVVGEGLGPPLMGCYIIGATGAVNIINNITSWSGYPEIFLDNESGGVWSLPIKEAIDNGYYSHFESGGGPSMMERLEGNLSKTDNGMESFVNLPHLQSKGIDVQTEKVSIDYLYFSNQSYIGQPVRGLQDWFRINSEHANRYNISGLM